MEILPEIEAVGKSLWIKKKKILIVADFHIGYEEVLIKQGILVPKEMFQEMKKEILELLKLKPQTIVINGDLKHEFGEISRQEWQETLEILDLLLKHSTVVLIRGNHDTILEPIARKRHVEVRNFLIIDDIAILHGHKIFIECVDKNIKTLIIGHDHPAVSIHDGIKQEKFKCFLLGKYKNKNIIVMPSFFSLNEGSDIKKDKLLSPFLKNIDNFEIFVLGDRVYDFGKVKDI